MDEADAHPARDELRLPRDHAVEQFAIVGGIGIVPRDDVIGQHTQALDVAARGEELERADADMAGRDARQHRAGLRRFAPDHLPGPDGGECARRGDAQSRHRFGDDIFPQDRPQRRAPVAAARERRRAGALELDVAAHAMRVDDLAEQNPRARSPSCGTKPPNWWPA